ncbi:hypothetical protein FOCC_FOCC014539 [Frankliniella occidentalis]|nr:hypothetical protein FOCC_FOCC014539 [Frankliniella occidentalis]
MAVARILSLLLLLVLAVALAIPLPQFTLVYSSLGYSDLAREACETPAVLIEVLASLAVLVSCRSRGLLVVGRNQQCTVLRLLSLIVTCALVVAIAATRRVLASNAAETYASCPAESCPAKSCSSKLSSGNKGDPKG